MTVLPKPHLPPFLIGDHLALDFVNSIAAPAGAEIDWLANGSALLDWLTATGAIDAANAARFRAGKVAARRLDAVAEQARALRGWLHKFLLAHAGARLDADALAELEPLNRLLARDESFQQVMAASTRPEPEGTAHGPFELTQQRRWTAPEQLLQPIAAAAADLVCHADFLLIRTCEGPTCTLMFYDRTKGHGRRWCSMSLCGNRAKAAAHRARLREARGQAATAAGQISD
jgi:predicted RNA-binding Zn ribbon-like protein